MAGERIRGGQLVMALKRGMKKLFRELEQQRRRKKKIKGNEGEGEREGSGRKERWLC